MGQGLGGLTSGKSFARQKHTFNKICTRTVLKYGEEAVSVAIEEVKPEDWVEKVYKPDILNNPERLFKKPGYTM